MRIISWNVNGIRAVEKKGFVDWLLRSEADVVCVQETKAQPAQLSQALLLPGSAADAGFVPPVVGLPSPVMVDGAGTTYCSCWSSAKKAGYSGTAIYARRVPDRLELLGDAAYDDEGRVLTAFFGTLAVISAYFPNSQGQGLRLDYKLGFCAAMLRYLDRLVADGYDVVLCGDYNIAHTPADIANPKANEGNAGYLPEERAWMDTFTASGYVDTFRLFCKEPQQYTWWSYRFHAREKNIGWRIDYQCVNAALASKVRSSVILKDVMGSDHCPVMVALE